MGGVSGTIPVIRFFKACDFLAETRDLFAKDCEVIHVYQNT
jgi:hypothetical protein